MTDSIGTVAAGFREDQQRHLMHSWGVQCRYEPEAVVDTEGCYMITASGRRIFDLRSAHECINLGFRHPSVLEAMRKQMERVVYVTDDFATQPTAALARRLAHLTPGSPNKRVWFGSSGAAAVEAAIKGARLFQYNKSMSDGDRNLEPSAQYPYPYKIITRYRSWHGATAAAATAGGDPRRLFQEPLEVPGFRYAPETYCYRCPIGHQYPECDLACADYLDRMIEQEGSSGKVAAVLIEPVVGSNGIIPPPPGYLPRLRSICDEHGILLIVDETMTGMGRTGRLFAFEHFEIEPDIVIVGKALGVYCPLTAAVFSERVASAFDENVFGHGQSYSGHALGCAAANASLDVLLDEGLLDHVGTTGSYLESKLRRLASTHEIVGDVRGMGLFWTLELVHSRSTHEPLRRPGQKYAPSPMKDLAGYLLDRHDIYVPGDKFGLWIVPPLIVTPAEIDMLVQALDDGLKWLTTRL